MGMKLPMIPKHQTKKNRWVELITRWLKWNIQSFLPAVPCGPILYDRKCTKHKNGKKKQRFEKYLKTFLSAIRKYLYITVYIFLGEIIACESILLLHQMQCQQHASLFFFWWTNFPKTYPWNPLPPLFRPSKPKSNPSSSHPIQKNTKDSIHLVGGFNPI